MKTSAQAFLKLLLAIRWFLLLVLLPTAVVASYLTYYATPVYVAEAQFTVRSQSGGGSDAGLLGGMLAGMGNSIANQDIAIVADYIQSVDILNALERELSLKQHFSGARIDPVSRLAADASLEDLFGYYLGKLEVLMNETTGIVSLKTKAFSPELAKAMGDQILRLSDDLVNDMSAQISHDSLAFAEKEVARAEQRLRTANEVLTNYRNLTNTLNPSEKAGAVMGIVTGLESALASARADRDQLLSYLRPDSSEVRAINARIQALEEQIGEESQRLTGEDNSRLSGLLQKYEQFTLEKEIANQLYTTALGGLEAARAEAARKQLYLVSFVKPSMAETATEPDVFWETLTAFAVLLLAYTLLGLIAATINDHVGLG